MDIISDCFFENFSQLERNSLHAYQKRQDLVEYFNILIEGCSRGTGCSTQESCRDAIVSILRYHEKCSQQNFGRCPMGNHHNILYVAMRLSFDWQLKDTATVIELLNHIYNCEETFERIWVGAFFGKKATDFFIAWKCDFRSKEENLRAMVYFIDHANNGTAEYFCRSKEKSIRFIDIPLCSTEMSSPLQIAVYHRLPEKVHILLRFGGQMDQPARVLEDLLNELSSNSRKYSYNLINCLCFLMRALKGIYLDPHEGAKNDSNVQRDTILMKYPYLIEDGIIPIRRSGILPPELKHLCRYTIRERLWQNYQLPNGIRTLPLPEYLHRYLDLLVD